VLSVHETTFCETVLADKHQEILANGNLAVCKGAIERCGTLHTSTARSPGLCVSHSCSIRSLCSHHSDRFLGSWFSDSNRALRSCRSLTVFTTDMAVPKITLCAFAAVQKQKNSRYSDGFRLQGPTSSFCMHDVVYISYLCTVPYPWHSYR
jgi:hypothetical protein